MSKISRSIVVAIFVALILFLGVSDFIYINNVEKTVNSINGWVKFGYIILVIVLVSLYT